ncbi:MAG: DUF2225 domain-containing protein [Firmicutes bacterium]|nr:DUF2225 domain-containing protein [Bacillota bacterium]
MTMMFHQKKICFVCKKESSHPVIASTHAFGSPDLDTRPPEGQRSTMRYWIQRCPHCGYVASDISKETPVTKSIVESRVYQECDGNLFFDSLAQNFFRQFLLAKKEENHKTAFFALLHAAWACDDNQETYGAIRCRRLAIAQLEQWMALPDREIDDETLLLIKADLLRRSCDFVTVINEFETMTMKHELHQKLIDFQVTLAKKEDAGRYSLDQIPA